MSATRGAGSAYPSGAPEFTFGLSSVRIDRWLFVLLLLAIVFSVLLQFKDSDCPFGIFKPVL